MPIVLGIAVSSGNKTAAFGVEGIRADAKVLADEPWMWNSRTFFSLGRLRPGDRLEPVSISGDNETLDIMERPESRNALVNLAETECIGQQVDIWPEDLCLRKPLD